MKITLELENVYVDEDDEDIDGTVTVNVEEHDVRAPAPEEDLEEWANEELFQFTGTGRGGDAFYGVKILKCDDAPALVGKLFEFGV